MSHDLYGVNLWLKAVSATRDRPVHPSFVMYSSGFASRYWRFERNKNVFFPIDSLNSVLWGAFVTERYKLGLCLRPPGLELRILCLEGSVISLISPSSGVSSGQKWLKVRFISFYLSCTADLISPPSARCRLMHWTHVPPF